MSETTFDIKASNLVRHIKKLSQVYNCEKTEADGKVNFSFNDKDGFSIEEFSFKQTNHPAMIRLISKIINNQKGANFKCQKKY